MNTAAERNSAGLTARLQAYVSEVAAEFDAAGESAFSRAQVQAIMNSKDPIATHAMFRGWKIDQLVRPMIQADPYLRHLKGRINYGVDFFDANTGYWWDMTTPAEWCGKLQKYTPTYGSNGTLLRTR